MPPNSGTDEAELANGDSAAYIRNMDRRLIVLETRFDTILPMLATKADLAELKAELKADISGLRTEMHDSIGALRTEMRDFKADIHKWMTATIITMFIGFGSMVVAILTLLRPA